MRILFIVHELSRSGAPKALLDIMDAVKKQAPSLSIDILALKPGVLYSEFAKRGRVMMFNPEGKRFRRIFLKFCGRVFQCPYWGYVWGHKYDLIYANTVVSLPVAISIKAKFQIPVIAHIHESESVCKANRLSPESLKQCDKIIAVSEFVKSILIREYSVPEQQVIVQYPFSDLSRLLMQNNKLAEAQTLDDGHIFTIGLCGYGGWVKAFDIFPLLVKRMAVLYPTIDFRFSVIGGFSDNDLFRLRFDLHHLAIEKHVIFHGNVSNPLDYFKEFDVFLLLSREDSFPLVVGEQAALRKPIVAFRGVTGIDEWLDNNSATFVPYLDIDAVARALYEYYLDRDKRARIGELARLRFEEFYKTNSSLNEILKVIL